MNLIDLFQNETEIVTAEAEECLFEEGDPGDMFGEMALIDDAPRSATARAITAVRLIPIDERRFNYLAQQTPYCPACHARAGTTATRDGRYDSVMNGQTRSL